MTLQEQEQFFKTYTENQGRIMLSKGNDYAGEDRLSCFKKVAAIVNTTPEQVALTLIGIKVARLGELLNNKEPNNESIEDNMTDLSNYSVLLAMIRADK